MFDFNYNTLLSHMLFKKMETVAHHTSHLTEYVR
jgi:hypothetical protein